MIPEITIKIPMGYPTASSSATDLSEAGAAPGPEFTQLSTSNGSDLFSGAPGPEEISQSGGTDSFKNGDAAPGPLSDNAFQSIDYQGGRSNDITPVPGLDETQSQDVAPAPDLDDTVEIKPESKKSGSRANAKK